MSNHEVSSEMKFNNRVGELLSLLVSIQDNALFAARNGWEKEREPETEIGLAAIELIEVFGKYKAVLLEIDKNFDKYADLVDAIDLWIGNDSGSNGVIREYRKLHA